MVYFDQILHTYFNIVQTLVCKTMSRVCQASFWPAKVLVKMLITLELHGIFDRNLHSYTFYHCLEVVFVKMLITLEPHHIFCLFV